MGRRSRAKKMVADAPKTIITELDERLFRGNSLATKLFQYFVIMGLLMVVLGPALDLVFELFDIRQTFQFLFQYISHSSLVLLLLLFFAIYSTHRILKPLKRLLRDVRKLHEGDFDVPLDAKGYDEIESLEKSVKRLRNSLMIATDLLGERDKSLDKLAVERISGISTTFALIIPFLLYGILLTFLIGIVYSPLVENPLSDITSMSGFIQACMVLGIGIGLAFVLGYVVAYLIGNPIHKLAVNAEKVSQGDMEADFKITSWGDIAELAAILEDFKLAIERAYEELSELEDGLLDDAPDDGDKASGNKGGGGK